MCGELFGQSSKNWPLKDREKLMPLFREKEGQQEYLENRMSGRFFEKGGLGLKENVVGAIRKDYPNGAIIQSGNSFIPSARDISHGWSRR